MPKGDEVCPESIKKIKAQSNYEVLVKRKSLEAEPEKLKKFMTGYTNQSISLVFISGTKME